jgi:DNA-directed RNA polymerase subunit alpha
MVAEAQAQISLFAENLPLINDIKKLSTEVHSSESSLLFFKQQAEEILAQGGSRAALVGGISLFILGKYKEAAEKLEKGKDCQEKFYFLAGALRRTKQFDKAVEALNKCLDFQADVLTISLKKVATYRRASNFESAEKELKKNANYENVSADYHYQLARLQEAQGLYDKAVENYKTAIELSPEHQKALFHLAYRCDIAGDEEAAIDYYKQITSTNPVYVSALLNLAVLYEDRCQFEKAEHCVDKVLQYHPNHKRAILFKKDIESSKTMVYDEDKEKKKTIRNQLLETPITDFELSVRSRNCLRKMNIRTIGDLMRITETELLSYKNFGETSLKEIKVILTAKNLHLGMALEEQQHSSAEPVYEKIVSENQSILSKPVDDLQLSVRCRKCLQRLNLCNIGELTYKTEAELLGVKNFGVTSLNEIKKVLSGYGLSLRSLD